MMAELLVRVRLKDGYDPAKNKLASQPGDVIAVCEDGWSWTKAELGNADWRIVKMSGVASDYAHLLEPALDAQGKVLFKRSQNLDAATVQKLAAEPAGDVTVMSPLDETALTVVAKDTAPIVIGG